MTKRVPERTCIACRHTGGKRGFCRIVRTPEGELLVDRTGKRSGRGAYVHPDAGCVREALKGERLARALRIQVTAEDKVRLQADLLHLVARADLLAQLSQAGGAPGAQAPPAARAEAGTAVAAGGAARAAGASGGAPARRGRVAGRRDAGLRAERGER